MSSICAILPFFRVTTRRYVEECYRRRSAPIPWYFSVFSASYIDKWAGTSDEMGVFDVLSFLTKASDCNETLPRYRHMIDFHINGQDLARRGLVSNFGSCL